jgi:outer membrane protein assembly factor BamD (BamD/ComL family)
VHMDYNLGRAEMLLGNDEAAAKHFEATVKTDTTPEVVEQAWYQLGTIYRRERRMDEARSAMATFQKLKDEEADKSQQRMKKLVSPADNSPTAAPADTQSPQ